MVGANLKAQTIKLMERRTALEEEMNAIIERLNRSGGPGISGHLVDSEGFPRTDIDIPSVRADRHRLSEIHGDYKDVTEKINQNIELLHSTRLAPETAKETGNGSSTDPDPNYSISVPAGASAVSLSRPFALVDEITEASPAAEDGLQLGDQVLKFGTVVSGENTIQRLAAEVQANQGKTVLVEILRQGVRINLVVTPRAWQGRGLMGCHFQMI